jgi:hypothetical protein
VKLSRTLDQLEQLPERLILVVNGVLGAFVALAHGGALVLIQAGVPAPLEYVESVRQLVPYTLPIAAVVVLSTGLGLLFPRLKRVVLIGQAIVLCGGTAALLSWALKVAAWGIPEGNFAWTPGLLTVLAAYSAYLTARFVLRAKWQLRQLRYAPVVAAVLVIPVDIAVFLRLAAKTVRM